jgi:hypothetical protein
VSGLIDVAGGAQSWQFVGTEGDIVTVHVSQAGGASLGPYVYLVDATGTTESSGDGSCGSDAKIANHRLRFTGTYRILVEGGCNSHGAYSLPLDVKASPPLLAYGASVTGEIGFAGDYAEYVFTGQADDVVTIRVTQVGGASLGPYVYLNDPTSTRVAAGDGTCGAEAKILNYQLRFSGTHTIRVEGGCGTKGGFRVQIIKKGPAVSLTYGAVAIGTISLPGDYQLFGFDGHEGDAVTIQVARTDSSGFGPYVYLVDASGAREAGGDGTCGANAQIADHKLRFTGPYKIRVEGGCNSTGSFSVALARR